ncbi:protein UL95 [Equid gammaherpesvirus 2]|nr:protein UL95 [Equid gammaherpesvirus 2]
MFALASMTTSGDEALNARYKESVSLSVGLCESLPEQFKLIETPINSFLLVANVMPNDDRPWDSHPASGADFHNIRMPRLERLRALIRCDRGYNNGKGGEAGQQAGEDDERMDEGVPEEGAPRSPHPPPSAHYEVYDSWSWQRALRVDKDDVIREAVAELAKPANWQGTAVEDPLPLMWLLFYGRRSFCDDPECLYRARFGHPGPLLLPNYMYRPAEDASSFLAGLCRCVRSVYGCEFGGGSHVNPAQVPFDHGRFSEALRKLGAVDDAGAHVSRQCLVCRLYRQNLMSRGIIGGRGSSIVLGGSGKKYLTREVGTRRCLELGDIALYPSYDISLILDDLEASDGLRQ